MYLAIDTCTETAGLALFDGQRVVAEYVWLAGRNHTVQTAPALDWLLRTHGLAPTDLTGLVVAKGPGGFNGIRVGMALAKGLALTLNIPVVGVSTLETHAYPFIWAGHPVWGLIEMGRGQVAAAGYESADGWPRRTVAERLVTPQEVCAEITGPTVFCGTLKPETVETITASLGNRALMPAAPLPARSPAALAVLGYRRLATGDHDDPAGLAPLYLRMSSVGE